MMDEWKLLLERWKPQEGLTLLSPVSVETRRKVNRDLNIPSQLSLLYRYSNGIVFGWFKVFPIEVPEDIKRTWDGILRANDPEKTRFLDGNDLLLRRYLVFACLDGGNCAVIDRVDESVWYEEEDELFQTNMTVVEFVDACLREVRDL